MGSSMAENHPVGFQWVMEAREKGAKVIHVDPRFTRTSAMADVWLPLRAGSDIIFLGGLIRYVLQNERYFHDYVVHYTNAPNLVCGDFRDTEDLDGFFSGWDAKESKYDPASWNFEGTKPKKTEGTHSGHEEAHAGHAHEKGGAAHEAAGAKTDCTLQDPRCVFQVLKRHFDRYTPEMVEQNCGIAKELFLKTADIFSSASGPERTAAICYAVGWTQHSKGVQIIRAASILQLLLGNIGRPGGGIMALRGHASIQGSTDIPTLYDILPGYLPMPMFESGANELRNYIDKSKMKTGLWAGFDKYFVSLMKAYYGEGATKENDWGFHWLPRVTGDHSHSGYWLDMADGKVEGLFVMGQNPAVGAANAGLQRTALAKLKWLVVRDMVEVETASFWLDSPEVQRGELDPGTIATEVFLMPAAGSAEKEGTFTNTQRLLQYREAAVEPSGDARSESWFMFHLGRRIKQKAANDHRARNEGLHALTWDYSTEGSLAEPNVKEVLMEINGYSLPDRKQLKAIPEIKNDGSTACGAWIYCGVFPEKDRNRANERKSQDLLGHGWAFAWPNDCRIIYNRASARPDGKPWSERKKLVWWDDHTKEWTGLDVPDYLKNMSPDTKPDLENGHGAEGLGGSRPFVLHNDGLGWIFVPTGLKDGPLPAHFEPLESLSRNPLYSQQNNPPADKKQREDNPYATSPGDERYPYILSTYRLTEHHTAGGMSRTLPHLAELQPEPFTEISPELAHEAGLTHGGYATISTPRGSIEVRVLVTHRMRPLWINGRRVHQVGLPWHYGNKGLAKGDAANDLLAISEEPNVRIMEAKALVCSLTPGRKRQEIRA
jgi:formate dehydrogenase major subunit